MSSSSQNTFASNQATFVTRMMNLGRQSPTNSTSTTRIVAPRPFYRSQITPDRFESPPNDLRIRRRFSAQQINASFDDDQTSSDESLSLEFPPPPRPFLSPTVQGEIANRSDHSGSPLSNSYLSDQEPSSPTLAMQTHYHPQYRTTNPNNRALISVSSSQSPLITIASAGSPNRSEIRVSSSPQTNKSTLREIRISRPDSPSILINRSQPTTNGSSGAFHISLGPPTHPSARLGERYQIEMRRDPPPSAPIPSSVPLPNTRFQPLSNAAIVNLPPASVSMRNGHTVKRDPNDVDHLTKLLLKSMNSANEPNFFGMCARCNDEIVGEENGLVAMDRMYHVSCFTCTMCGCRLRGMHFYSMENKPYCESCYINSLEKCSVCTRPITDRILRATGKPYHAQCFCCVACEKSLDGVPFTVDAHMQIHCIDCFHQKFAPRCYVCQRAILPNPGQEETVRIVALDRSYHPECYRCESCQTQFTSDDGCYPLEDHIFCLQCHRMYAKQLLGHA